MKPSPSGLLLFETTLGVCGVAWATRGLLALRLPEASPKALRARLIERLGVLQEGAPPDWVNEATRRVVAHLAGHDIDLAIIPLALDTVPDFHRRVFEQARCIARGETITYGDLAVRAGAPGGARAVGQAMARNPWPVIVPCHRVLARNGAGGFSAPGALVTKARLLDIEGVCLATAHRPEPRYHQHP